MIIKDIICPGCQEEALTYNGNYFCTECNWVMESEGIPTVRDKEIMRAYMTQVRDSTKDNFTKDRMNFYLDRMDKGKI